MIKTKKVRKSTRYVAVALESGVVYTWQGKHTINKGNFGRVYDEAQARHIHETGIATFGWLDQSIDLPAKVMIEEKEVTTVTKFSDYKPKENP